MEWTKERPTKPGLYAAIHLHETIGGYGKVKVISVAEDLVPPLSSSEGFDWDSHDAPMEQWVKVLVAWGTGSDGPCGLDYYTWFCAIELPPVPIEILLIQKLEDVRERLSS